MSTLNPGEHTAIAEKLRGMLAEKDKKPLRSTRKFEAKMPSFDSTGVVSEKNHDSPGKDYDVPNTYHGPETEGYGGGRGPNIGARYYHT